MIPQNFVDDFYRRKPSKPDKPDKPTCPLCGEPVDYVGFTNVDCSNPDCKNYNKITYEIKEDDWEIKDFTDV